MQTEQGNDCLWRFHAGGSSRNQIIRKVTKENFKWLPGGDGALCDRAPGGGEIIVLSYILQRNNHTYTLSFKNIQVRFHCIPVLGK